MTAERSISTVGEYAKYPKFLDDPPPEKYTWAEAERSEEPLNEMGALKNISRFTLHDNGLASAQLSVAFNCPRICIFAPLPA